MDQEAAATALGIHAVTLSRYENGKRPVPDAVRVALAELYGLPGNAFDDSAMQQTDTGDAGYAAGDDGGLVPVPATTLAYWRGRFDTMADWAHALDTMMQAQREQFARFTQGVADFRESGVLPPAPPRPRPTKAETTQLLSAAGIRPAAPPDAAAGND